MSPHFTSELSALVLIDYQVGTMQLIKNQMPDTSLRNAIALGNAALAFDMPIVLTSSQEDHLQGPIGRVSPACTPKAVRGAS
jgi:nicotinamidase-related amidase